MNIIRNHNQGNHHRALSKSQTGAVLLMFLLILVTSASYSLLNQLNASTNLHTRQQETNRALSEAKQALIGYAITYPDKVNSNAGPGYLPCPDLDNDGDAEGGCALVGPTNWTIGRFPNETLNVQELKDASGQRLWYVLSDNFRNFAGFEPLNSDTPGQLCIDVNFDDDCEVVADGDIDDIVAIIIAPGAQVDGQNRDPNETDIANEISNYLDGGNNDFNTIFETYNDDGDNDGDLLDEDFNDILILITRQELMGLVEKRVLAEVEDTINNYQTTYNAFPWLSPFANPSSSAFRGQIATTQGHIPFHYSADTSGVAGRNPFQTTVGWIWNATGTVTGSFSGTVSADCLRNVDCNDGTFPQLAQVTTPAINCTWSNINTVNCPSAGSVTMSTIVCDLGCGNFTCTRAYNIDIPAYTGTSVINNPTVATTRTRDVILNGSMPTQTAAVSITDTYIGLNPSTGCSTTTTRNIGAGVINFVAATTGTLGSRSIQYDLDIDNNELPVWFFTNSWQNLIYVAYASSEALPGDTTDILPGPADGIPDNACTSGTDCISVNINGAVSNNVRATAFSAGVDLNAARPSGTLGDYFEGENSTPVDDSFVKNTLTTTYNDQSRIISTAP